jgi:hypothetical protein
MRTTTATGAMCQGLALNLASTAAEVGVSTEVAMELGGHRMDLDIRMAVAVVVEGMIR